MCGPKRYEVTNVLSICIVWMAMMCTFYHVLWEFRQ